MEVDRIADGLWRWTAFHEEWKQDVGCVYCESGDAVCLIDPLVPPEDRDRFLAALDHDVERLGMPVHILVTVYWHTRSARELAERYDAEVWASSRIRAAVERKTPLFAICRGFQELNVALGGSLHQAVHDVDGHSDHRARSDLPLDEMHGPVHPVSLRGTLRDWVGSDEIMVNSLHWQGIARLADGLKPEAFAEDGLVEAVRGPDDATFCLGVQWHPEWGAKSNPVSTSLFRRFGAAAKGVAS